MVDLRNVVYPTVCILHCIWGSTSHVFVVMGGWIFPVFDVFWMYRSRSNANKRKTWNSRTHIGRFPGMFFPLSQCNRTIGMDFKEVG